MCEECVAKKGLSKQLQDEVYEIVDRYKRKLLVLDEDAPMYFSVLQDLSAGILVRLIDGMKEECIDDVLSNVCSYAKDGLKVAATGVSTQEIAIEKKGIKGSESSNGNQNGN